MTVASTANKVTYSGNGATTLWTFTFPGVAASDISVIYEDAAGIETTLNPALYTLALNAAVPPNPTGAGGSVTYPLSGPPIAVGTTLSIIRTLPDVQATSLANQGTSYPAAIEQALDYLTMIDQQSAEQIGRAILVAVGDPVPVPLPPVAQRRLLYMAFDSAGNPIAAAGGGSATPVSAAMAPVVAAATLALGRTAFGLGNLATGNVGQGLQSGVIAANQVDVNFPNATAGVSRALAATDHMHRLVATANITLTAPRGNTLWNGFGYWLDTKTFTVTLALDSHDNFENGSSGTSLIFPPGTRAYISNDAAGAATWYFFSNQVVNPVVNKTGAYGVVQGDNGSTFILKGNAYYTFTVGVAAGFVGPYTITIVNGDPYPSGRGKLISLNAITPFILWPGQQITVTLDIANVVWTYSDPGRWRVQGLILYVDAALGSDSNDGLLAGAGGALATLTQAYRVILRRYIDTQASPPNIQLASGTISVATALDVNYPLVGASQFSITGDSSSLNAAANYIISCSAGQGCFNVRDLATVTMVGVSLQTGGNGSTAFSVSNECNGDLNAVVFGAFPAGAFIGCSTHSDVNFLSGCRFTGNTNNAWTVSLSGVIQCTSFTHEVPNVLTFATWAAVNTTGAINAGCAFSGAGGAGGSTGKQFSSTTAGGIVVAGTTFPGATAGTTTAPGWAG